MHWPYSTPVKTKRRFPDAYEACFGSHTVQGSMTDTIGLLFFSATRFQASLWGPRRVSFRKRIGFCFCPALTRPYNCICHSELTAGAAGASQSTRTLPCGMPQVRNSLV